MTDVTVEGIIRRPVADVAAYVSDPSNAPEWYVNIRSAEWQTEPPVAAGSRITFTARFLGRDLVYTYEVTELVPGERMVMRTAQGPFPMNTTYTWQADGDGDGDATRMALRNHGEPRGFSRLMAPMMGAAMRKAMTKDLARLASILEGRD